LAALQDAQHLSEGAHDPGYSGPAAPTRPLHRRSDPAQHREDRQQFKSRTELFIGPKHHDEMGEIYVRSAVEHLHENRYLEGFDRKIRLDLVKKEAFVEHIARKALARIIGNTNLWLYFANTTSLAAFWALPQPDQRRIWGDPINPLDALADFDPRYIHDGHLGGP